MLNTALTHLESEREILRTLKNYENVIICCGRMGPMCTPVYGAMQSLQLEYPHVAFRDLDFDTQEAAFVRNIPACALFRGLPFTVYFKNGKPVAATTSIQSREEIVEILDREFGKFGENKSAMLERTENIASNE
jgi:thioredoxin 1